MRSFRGPDVGLLASDDMFLTNIWLRSDYAVALVSVAVNAMLPAFVPSGVLGAKCDKKPNPFLTYKRKPAVSPSQERFPAMKMFLRPALFSGVLCAPNVAAVCRSSHCKWIASLLSVSSSSAIHMIFMMCLQ